MEVKNFGHLKQMGLMLANILDTFEVPMDTTAHRPTVEEIR